MLNKCDDDDDDDDDDVDDDDVDDGDDDDGLQKFIIIAKMNSQRRMRLATVLLAWHLLAGSQDSTKANGKKL